MTNTETSDQEVETAYHEAGHAVVGCLLGRLPLFTTIIREGPVAGKTEFEPSVGWRHLDQSPAKRRYAKQRVYGELAGSIAHDLFKPERTRDLADQVDLHYAKQLTIELVSWEDHEEYLDRAKVETRRLIEDNWSLVDAVARALQQHKTLSREQLITLIPIAAE
jgi:ATP-dependent Zn protease